MPRLEKEGLGQRVFFENWAKHVHIWSCSMYNSGSVAGPAARVRYWQVQCREPKTGQQKVQLDYEDDPFAHLSILFIYGLECWWPPLPSWLWLWWTSRTGRRRRRWGRGWCSPATIMDNAPSILIYTSKNLQEIFKILILTYICQIPFKESISVTFFVILVPYFFQNCFKVKYRSHNSTIMKIWLRILGQCLPCASCRWSRSEKNVVCTENLMGI